MARRMSCGHCGGIVFYIEADSSDFPTILVIECTLCGSRTIYQPETPRMKQSWGELSDGVTCFIREEKDG